MSNFADLMRDYGLPALEEHLGETVTYQPAGQPERSITLLQPVYSAELQDGLTIDNVELIEVTAARTSNGITNPQQHDKIVWLDKVFAYTGRILNETSYSFRLEFKRRRAKATNTQSRDA